MNGLPEDMEWSHASDCRHQSVCMGSTKHAGTNQHPSRMGRWRRTKHAWEYQACRWGPVHRIESTNQHLKGMELSIARPRGDRFRAEKWEEEMAQK